MAEEQISTAIDLSKIRNVVTKGGPSVGTKGEAKSSAWHDLDYLNTNIQVPALKALRDRLNSSTEPWTSKEKEQHEKALFDVMKQWAFRSKTNDTKGVYKAYQDMRPSSSVEARAKFIQHCADVSKINERGEAIPESWAHNQVEAVAARALLSITKGESPKDVKESLDQAMSSYISATSEQFTKDINRVSVIIAIDEQAKHYNPNDLTQEEFSKSAANNLTGEQIGFISTLWDQGKFGSGFFCTPATKATTNLVIPSDTTRTDLIIKKDNGRLLAICSAEYFKRFSSDGNARQDHQVPEQEKTSVSMIVDITDLKGDSFAPGCASANVPMKILLKGTKKELKSFNIPSNIQTKLSEADKRLQQDIDPALPLEVKMAKLKQDINPALPPEVTEAKLKLAGEKNQNSDKIAEILAHYFGEKLKSVKRLDDKSKNEMTKDVKHILSGIKDEKMQKELKNEAGAIVRGAASATEGRTKLSWKETFNKIKDAIKGIIISRSSEAHNIIKDMKGFITTQANSSLSRAPSIKSEKGLSV